jgi:two-component system phosphate regulon response regulator PhoB
MGLVLRDAGFTVRTASHGRMAFEMAAQDPPDLVVTDFQMPLMNGLELATKLREHEATADVPVIMLTSRSHRLDDEEMALTRIVKLLPKPFSPREVTQEVARVLEPASPSTEAA